MLYEPFMLSMVILLIGLEIRVWKSMWFFYVNREPNVLQGSETTIFPCERWLAKSEDDGETVRELVPSDIITEKLLRDGTLKHNEIEVEDALESMWPYSRRVSVHFFICMPWSQYSILIGWQVLIKFV